MSSIRNKLTVKDFIDVLKTFPQSWEISIGDGSGEESYPIKGVFNSNETDYEMPRCSSAYVQIEPFDPFYGLDLEDIISEESVEMYGDRNWYNTNEVYKRSFKNGEISFHLTDEGKIKIISCEDYGWTPMSIDDIEEYTHRTLSAFYASDHDFKEDLFHLEEAIETVQEKYSDNQDIQKAIREIVELKKELSS